MTTPDEDRIQDDSTLAGLSAEEMLGGRGYVVLPDFFDPAPVLSRVEAAVSEHLEEDGRVFSGGYRPDVLMDPEVQQLMLDPRLLDMAWRMLATKPAFGSLGCNSVPPGSDGMDPHFDYPYFAMPRESLPRGAFPALCVQVIWYLTDVEEDMGPTMVVPGSQASPGSPTSLYYDLAVPVLARAGTVFVGHGALWHGVGKNASDRVRHAVLGSYVPFWVHPMLRPSYGAGQTEVMRELMRSDFSRRIGEGYSATIASSRTHEAVMGEEPSESDRDP